MLRTSWLCVLTAILFACPVSADEPLRLLVFGATGSVGSLIVDEALSRGHAVTAVSRDPSSIDASRSGLTAARGDLLNRDSIGELLEGHDVVISSVRGVIGDKSDPENALQLLAASNIIAELREFDGKPLRFLHIGGAGSLEVEPGKLFAETLPKIALPKSFESEIIGQIWTLDDLREVHDVEWTYITPPINLKDGERTGEYRIGGDEVLRDERGKSRISKADFAVAVVDEAENAHHTRQRISIAN
ncbi:MAG: NAD(P)H-binding protein [Pseudomonadota bacterium]